MLLLNFMIGMMVVVIALSSRKQDRNFFWVFSFSTLYYGVASLWYWGTYEKGYFLGVNWGGDIDRAALYLCVASLLVASFARLLLVNSRKRLTDIGIPSEDIPFSGLFFTLLTIGMLCAIYVLLRIITRGGLERAADPFVLIAYQFSDLLIPVIIFAIAARGYRPFVVILIVFYSYYSIAVGFRYRLFLFLVPIVIGEIRSYKASSAKRKMGPRRAMTLAFGGVLSIGLMWLFSFMTAARHKFSGVDFQTAQFSGLEAKLYGFFAEGNILFGLVSAIKGFIDSNNPPFAYLTPFGDTILELIPKFLVPWRKTGEYYKTIATGLVTDQAANSGTTYPFVGEYIVMYGYLGILLGCAYYACVYVFFSKSIAKNSSGISSFQGYGSALLAAFFGYYFYSRGYIPQVLKGVLFVVVPYILLLKKVRREVRRRVAEQQHSADRESSVNPVVTHVTRLPANMAIDVN